MTAPSYRRPSLSEHFTAAGPKRILALDGGGLRGVVTLGMLARIETILREQHGGDPHFRLAHYFDLIAGTSTGAIIAAALAKGLSVAEILGHYLAIGRDVFRRSLLRQGILNPRYDEAKLIDRLKLVLGPDTRLGGAELLTGLLVVTKRLDTGSPWPLGNNPAGRYYRAAPTDDWISNADYPLWQVVRASTAAPSYFEPEAIRIAEAAGKDPVEGNFIDGGVSPFNNPSLQALMYATLRGYHVNWPVGEDRLLVVSVGTGRGDPGQAGSGIAALGALRALLGLMSDCATLVDLMMRWLSRGGRRGEIDGDIGTLADDVLGGMPQFTYRRYDVSLWPADVRSLVPEVTAEQLKTLPEMDVPENLELLQRLGRHAAAEISPDDFPAAFRLPVPPVVVGGRRPYLKRAGTSVVAIQVALATPGFSYEKWGATQTCKPGDWIVDNGGDVYTVDGDTFARTYQADGLGIYRKTGTVWAEVAANDGAIQTKEGTTNYRAGAYLVFNDPHGEDGYAVEAAKFEAMYRPAD
jgi:hypothetical protein